MAIREEYLLASPYLNCQIHRINVGYAMGSPSAMG